MTPGCGAVNTDCWKSVPNRNAMLAAIGRMTPGDMPQFDPAMQMAVASLTRTPPRSNIAVIISDGDPSDPSPATIASFKANNITISTVAVASHGPDRKSSTARHRAGNRRKVLRRRQRKSVAEESSSVKPAACRDRWSTNRRVARSRKSSFRMRCWMASIGSCHRSPDLS